jgi:site-specific recombinase XerD
MLKSIIRRRSDAPAGAVKEVVKASEPELERRGYRRSHITLPAYRLGVSPPNKGQKFPAEPLTPAEVWALVEACEQIGRAAKLRNQALIVLLWRSGLRCAEMLALYPKDLDLDVGRVAVLHGKGDKRRIVGLDAAACEMLRAWMAARTELGLGAGEPVFCVVNGPTRGLAVGSPYVRDLLKRLATVAGITKRVHPHGLRHTYASHLIDEGVPLHYLKRMLGHTSLAITEKYADHLNPFQAVERVNAVSWPAREAA